MEIAVLLCNNYPKVVINGAIIDAFEYYFAILEHNKDIKLFLIDFNDSFFNYLIALMSERYYLDDLKWKENIIRIKRFNIINYDFERVLIVDYSTINRLRGLIKSKNLDVITEITVISDLYTNKPEFMFRKDLYNVNYYGEMPFVYKDYKYRMKLLFNRFREIKDSYNGYFIHSPKNDQIYNLPIILNLPRDVPIFFKEESHMNNFFEYFNRYIYYHSGNYFDPHPRLPLECAFYGKYVSYVNKHGIEDGSFYRFEDLELNWLDCRTLDKNDEIVKLFI